MHPELVRRTTLQLPEFPDKIADVIKTAFHADLKNRHGGIGKQLAGPVDAVGDQILDGSIAGDLPEKPAQVLAVAGDQLCQVIQGNMFGVMFFHVGDDLFITADLLLVGGRPGGIGLLQELGLGQQGKKFYQHQLTGKIPVCFSFHGKLHQSVDQWCGSGMEWIRGVQDIPEDLFVVQKGSDDLLLQLVGIREFQDMRIEDQNVMQRIRFQAGDPVQVAAV